LLKDSTLMMAGPVPPAGPKPLRRGEGPAIHVFSQDVDAGTTAGHDEGKSGRARPMADMANNP
jgi:hypothetical protein